MLDDHHLLTVTDIKQFRFCPRIIFYERCLPHIRPRTYKMDAGRDAHESEERRARRRTLSKYELDNSTGERLFNVSVLSESLGITGTVDELVITEDNIYPVDYKLAKRVSPNHRLQVAAYAMILEEMYDAQIERGFIYLILNRKTIDIEISPKLREHVYAIISEIEYIISNEQMPHPTLQQTRCINCEFRRFCNDI